MAETNSVRVRYPVRGVDEARAAMGEQLVHDYLAGASIQDLAVCTGRSYSFVRHRLLDAGVVLRGRGGGSHRPTRTPPELRHVVERDRGAGIAAVDQVLWFRGVVVRISGSRVSVGRGSVRLSGRESRLLEALASSPGRVFSKEELLELMWGRSATVSVGALTVAVNYVRAKLERIDARDLLRTERGRGYRLAATAPGAAEKGSSGRVRVGVRGE